MTSQQRKAAARGGKSRAERNIPVKSTSRAFKIFPHPNGHKELYDKMTTPTIDTLEEILAQLAEDLINYDQRMVKAGAPNVRFTHKYTKEARTKILAEITKARIDELTKLYGFSDSGLMFPSEYLKIRLGELRAGLSGGEK